DSSRGAAGLFFSARFEGPPFHRGGSASKKNGPADPLHIFLRPRVARARRATGCPLHFLPHFFPLLCHLRLARHLALWRFGHHHGIKTPLEKRFRKGFRAAHAYLDRLPAGCMHFVKFLPQRLWIRRQHENVPDRKLLILEPLSRLRVNLSLSP